MGNSPLPFFQLQVEKVEFPGKQPINHLSWISFSCVLFFWAVEVGESNTLMENLNLGFPRSLLQTPRNP